MLTIERPRYGPSGALAPLPYFGNFPQPFTLNMSQTMGLNEATARARGQFPEEMAIDPVTARPRGREA